MTDLRLPIQDVEAARASRRYVVSRVVIYGIRPEHFSRRTPETAGRPGMATLTAPVVLVEPTGAETMAVLRIGTKEITGRFDPNEAPKQGEEMILNVDMTRACLFDPASERLIRTAS